MTRIKSIGRVLGLFGVMALNMALSKGEKAPTFGLPNQDGKIVQLSDSVGHPVLLYFYPKDGTPGCTEEACTLRDTFKRFQELGAVIYGISTQDSKSHTEFRAKHKLPFDLLVDADGEIAKKYGVGTLGITGLLERKSILIGPDGRIAKVYETVNPAKHAEEVLHDLAGLKT